MKPHIILKKTSTGVFEVADETTQEWAEKVKVGKEMAFKEVSKSRSILEHNLFYSFIHFVYDNQDRYDNFEVFRYTVSLHAGAGVWRAIERNGVVENHFIPFSWKFIEMPQHDFHHLVEHGCRHIKETYGIDIEEWKSHREQRGNTSDKVREKCPGCESAATDRHQLIPGNSHRERCEKLGYVIMLCHDCHEKSHGLSTPREEKIALAKKWFSVIGVDYDEGMRKVMGNEKLYSLRR